MQSILAILAVNPDQPKAEWTMPFLWISRCLRRPTCLPSGVVAALEPVAAGFRSARSRTWKLAPIAVLAACSATEPTQTEPGADASPAFRFYTAVEYPLYPVSETTDDEAPIREFGRGDTTGWVTEEGVWRLRVPVVHTRLRCAVYETGIELGVGNPDCFSVRWVTDPEFGSRRTQCNSAVLIHTANGQLADGERFFSQANCVRVLTRCKGAC